jgi:virulence-associated protein VapD
MSLPEVEQIIRHGVTNKKTPRDIARVLRSHGFKTENNKIFTSRTARKMARRLGLTNQNGRWDWVEDPSSKPVPTYDMKKTLGYGSSPMTIQYSDSAFRVHSDYDPDVDDNLGFPHAEYRGPA